jgi:hypothetical protein
MYQYYAFFISNIFIYDINKKGDWLQRKQKFSVSSNFSVTHCPKIKPIFKNSRTVNQIQFHKNYSKNKKLNTKKKNLLLF